MEATPANQSRGARVGPNAPPNPTTERDAVATAKNLEHPNEHVRGVGPGDGGGGPHGGAAVVSVAVLGGREPPPGGGGGGDAPPGRVAVLGRPRAAVHPPTARCPRGEGEGPQISDGADP